MIKQREHEELEEMKKAIREEDFLDEIMSNEDLNYEEKVSIVLDILLGGFETSATLLSLVVYFLAKSPNLFQKLKVISFFSLYMNFYICAFMYVHVYTHVYMFIYMNVYNRKNMKPLEPGKEMKNS